MAEHINSKYNKLCEIRSDINEHLPTLYRYSKECERIFETGVRGCVSSWAFTKGLLENGKSNKVLFMNDISPCNIQELLDSTKSLPITIQYTWINNLQLNLPYTVDMTFIDTWHVYGQLKRELEKFSKITNKYIIMHDTLIDGIYGETVRSNWNAEEQSRESGFPVEEITKGLLFAIQDFLEGDRIIAGGEGEAIKILRKIYEPLIAALNGFVGQQLEWRG
jgi:hypothetical protein